MEERAQRNSLFLELEARMQQRANGVLFVATRKKRSICLGLTDGWLTYCAGGRAHGQQAVMLFTEAEVASFAFTHGGDCPFHRRDEIVHDQAMAVLNPLINQAQLDYEESLTSANSNRAGRRFYRGQRLDGAEPERIGGSSDREARSTRFFHRRLLED